MKWRLVLDDDALADLKRIAEQDADAYARLRTVLGELEGDQDALDGLTDERNRDSELDVMRVVNLQRRHWNVWRCKIASLDVDTDWVPYRIIYAVDQRRCIWILAVGARREIGSYDETSPLIRRALEAYLRLGIPKLPR
jgi:mRNA-degrading endonuclease RelE of RelBE toxin-antitoxin system